ncbi:HK97 gp10 family phage protein [Chengkuizengella axinellae]|uniref:HK97 gp10 family phage protein n=1 Tax=Chengkuizengella axinellae TaxID=3064388 RepID=A0ABT9IYB5_9BACL|nr:HK97 gp10 family phage protein [Chengkuizengella sp. 2205SS18-9]MDP5274351.1 HK97 gp10 family phage protein [Chengkuizengella sp. 2205SS18-9]
MDLQIDTTNLFKGLDLTKKNIQERAIEGMQKAADDLLKESKKLAPKKSGDLRMSAKVEVYVRGDTVTGEVVYTATSKTKSGWKYNYALKLHEMGKFKNPTTSGTSPKFLSRPLKAKYAKYMNDVASEIRRETS